ncbi:DUF1281 domain-containing protein [Escherichia marmotae]|uniref:DUF1281 domain-containing protein n=1 Tax=Escherichia marmotae TaxID=1499973 RepID=UPI002813F9F2|nr:DUF1281 domain-containing protein [Escherichia marmotae]MDQ9215556.1 DUF1281 domain-containing protein [Escherichia marmotae]MDQ9273044.1 DUF1281 domain-containing protein [Escherichia marmotae]MDQ9315641.1 DUF1281 domain-containing protein [Escherichia marmotae]
MSEWCQNRFEITGKSVCLDVLTQWIEGCEIPRYRHAIQQSIQLFLAGCAGLVKPTRTTQYPPYPALVRHGTGMSSPANQAFEQWLGLLVKDAVLDEETIKTIDRLYHQSCIGAVRWGNLPENAREIITTLMRCQYSDWFGLVGLSEHIDAGACWNRLSDYPEQAQPCDMLMVIPSRLATELNGSGGLLQGISTTTSLYSRIYGVEWPSGHNVRWVRDEMSSLVLLTDTPWYPPSGELVGEISKVFDCEIRHWYSEPVRGIQGYNCYDGGEHTDSDPQAAWPGRETLPQPRLYLVEERAEEQTEAAPLPVPLGSGQ